MKQRTYLFVFCAICANVALAQNSAPTVSNVIASADWNTKTLTVNYDATDSENDPLEIKAELSIDNGLTYGATAQAAFTGDIGSGIVPGNGKTIHVDLSGINFPSAAQCRVRIIAADGQPFDLQALVNEVDSNRLRNDLAFVEGIRHRSAGLPHLMAVQDTIERLFRNRGLHFSSQTWNYSSAYTAKNLIGTQRGIGQSNKVVVIDAHYDSVSNAPGADDNGSGVVGFLEISRLLSRFPCNKTLRYIGFDLEEAGLVGSLRYVNNGGIPQGETIENVLNFEMIGFYSSEPNSQTLPTGFNILFPEAYNEVSNNGFRGDFITNVGNSYSIPLMDLFTAQANTYVPDLKVISVASPGNGSAVPDLLRSDHAPFWGANIHALMLTDGANFRNECYHTPNDTAENKLNFTFMSQVVKATLATAFQLAEVQHGGWGTAHFVSPTVGTQVPEPCKPSLKVIGHQLTVDLMGCTSGPCYFTLFNEAGLPVFEQNWDATPNSVINTGLGQFPAGVYVARLQTPHGTFGERVVILK